MTETGWLASSPSIRYTRAVVRAHKVFIPFFNSNRQCYFTMDMESLRAELRTIQEDESLWHGVNLAGRAHARAFAALLHNVASARRHQPEVAALYRQMSQMMRHLNELDSTHMRQMRLRIGARDHRGSALRRELDCYTAYRSDCPGRPHFAVDSLDYLLQGVLTAAPFPDETRTREPGMIHLELSPARVILEFIDRTEPQTNDVFYDLGSGLGQVVLLVHLLTGIRARGVEVEPAYVVYARRAALELGITDVEFVNADARCADLRAGTLFYLFTPFRSTLLDEVLQRLHAVAQDHPIQIGAYGACSHRLAQQTWLTPQDDYYNDEFKLAIFHSAPLEKV